MSATPFDGLAIGAIVWSDKHRKAGEGSESTRGGMVVDFGVYEDTGKPYVVHLQELTRREVEVAVRWKGSKTAKEHLVACLERMDLDEIDPDTMVEPSATRMEGWARKAMLGAVLLPWAADNHLALIGAAGALLAEGKTLTAELRAQTEAHVAEFNADLEAKRHARRAAS